MTKLMEWVIGVGTIMAAWAVVVFGLVDGIPQRYRDAALPIPFLLIIAFGIYSLGVIIYRVLTFNDCPEAAEELKAQIKEARKDLESKGFKFESKKDS